MSPRNRCRAACQELGSTISSLRRDSNNTLVLAMVASRKAAARNHAYERRWNPTSRTTEKEKRKSHLLPFHSSFFLFTSRRTLGAVVDAVREAPRILLRGRKRRKSASKGWTRGEQEGREFEEKFSLLAFACLLFFFSRKGECLLLTSKKKLEREREKKNSSQNAMSSARRTSPRRAGVVANDLRARPGQADATVSL